MEPVIPSPHYYSLCHPPSLLVPLQSVYGRPITNNFHMNKAHLTILVSMLPTRTAWTPEGCRSNTECHKPRNMNAGRGMRRTTQSSKYAGKYVEWPVMRRMGGWRATVNSVMKLKHDFDFPRVKGHVDG